MRARSDRRRNTGAYVGGDYAAFRYGPKTPTKVKMPRILAGVERKAVENHVKQILDSWESSKFQFEGPCRHGLRSTFCLQGHTWSTSDAEAEALVAEGLKRIGAVRPSWREGQPEYTQDGVVPVERLRCAHCGNPIPEDRGSRNGPTKYCSELCGQAAYARKARIFGETVTRAEYLARQAAKSRATAEREKDCQHCGKSFRPGYAIKRQRFCSPECGKAARKELPTGHLCTCVACGKNFRSRIADQKYCSRECYDGIDRGGAHHPTRQCPACHTIFQVHVPAAKTICCSRTCAWVLGRTGAAPDGPITVPDPIASLLAVGETPRLSPAIFDHFISIPAALAAGALERKNTP
jgi:hypothetical protein